MPNPIGQREQWLMALVELLSPQFAALGHPLPAVRASCGFPSKGMRSKVIGECWSPLCAADGISQIFVHPKYSDTVEVAAILVHELTHAAVGLKTKHHGPFKTVALGMGLEGEMTATHAGLRLVHDLDPMVEAIGTYPHASLVASATSAGKKQTTRLIKCACAGCGYTVRTTRQWLARGYPICPTCNGEME